jgi:hypothetical protein
MWRKSKPLHHHKPRRRLSAKPLEHRNKPGMQGLSQGQHHTAKARKTNVAHPLSEKANVPSEAASDSRKSRSANGL